MSFDGCLENFWACFIERNGNVHTSVSHDSWRGADSRTGVDSRFTALVYRELGLCLPNHFPRHLVLAQSQKPGVTQVSIRSPFDEFELAHKRWL